jgi:anti-sigma-K factor RskA
LALRLSPMRPSPHVWAEIEKRIGAAAAAAGHRPAHGTPPVRARAPAWRALAAGVALLVVLIGGFAAWRITQGPSLQQLATLADPNASAPAWRIESDSDLRHLRAVALGGATPQAGKSFELWALPDDGGAPVSLGLMPTQGEIDRDLTGTQRLALQGASKVAVSLEPEGGSTTGLPTGPVLFVADRIKRV